MRQYPDVTLPVIHRNGDRKEVLVSQLEAAYDAVSAAFSALKQCSPNGRNYYHVPGSMQLATTQHDARMQALYTVMMSLEAEAIGIQKQTNNR